MDEVTIELRIPVSMKEYVEAEAERLGISVERYINFCLQKYAEVLMQGKDGLMQDGKGQSLAQ